MKSKKNFSSKSKFIYGLLSLILVILYGITNNNFKNIFNDKNFTGVFENIDENFDMQVHFLNVGKADSAYIKFRDKNILIDAGDNEPTSTVVEYLKRNNVEKLDLVCVSHPHRDHIGQMSSVINEFEISKFIEPKVPEEIIPTGRTYEKMLKSLKFKNVDAKLISGQTSFNIDNLKLEILGPISSDNKNINNNSIVLKMTYGNISFLFMGDAEIQEENEILKAESNLKSNVLKVGHHGSKTSSSYNFLKQVQPDYAIISVGHDKSNLPKEEIIKRIEKFTKEIYRTDINGNIVVKTDGNEIKITTEKSKEY